MGRDKQFDEDNPVIHVASLASLILRQT